MKIQAYVPATLIGVLVALAGCGDAFTGPERANVPEGPAEFPLWDASVVSGIVMKASAPPQTVQTSDGTRYNVLIEQTLFADGKAVGVAKLFGPDDLSTRYVYRFKTGRTACEDGIPVARLEGVVELTGRDEPVSFAWLLLPNLEQDRVFPSGGVGSSARSPPSA